MRKLATLTYSSFFSILTADGTCHITRTILRRSMKHATVFLLVIASLTWISCAPSVYDITEQLLQSGKNDEAIALSRRSLSTAPDDALFLKYLGVGNYNKKLYAEAVPYFEKSIVSDPDDDQCVYYLASSYEGLSEGNKAIQYYRRYMDMTVFGEFRELVAARVKMLYAQQMEAEAKKAVAEEAQLETSSIPANTVAVLYFENKGAQRNLDPLQKGIAEMLITDLSKVKSLRVVERIRMQKMMEELRFSQSGLVDDKSAPRMGRLLGANRLLKGSFFDLTSDRVRLDALVARSNTGQLDAATDITGSTKDFVRLEKELVFKVLNELKIAISDDEREAILTIPTENLFAFLQYSRGLDLEDQGMYGDAAQAYAAAIAADPSFSQARTNMVSAQHSQQVTGGSSSSASSGSNSGASSMPVAAPPPPPSSAATLESTGAVSERVTSSAANVNSGFTPTAVSQASSPAAVIKPLPSPMEPPK
jgi:TolB-like protein